MGLTVQEMKYLEERRDEIRRELEELRGPCHAPRYHNSNERRIDLQDELEQVEAELERANAG